MVEPIDSGTAVLIAKRVVAEHGYAWIEPIAVSLSGDAFIVKTNSASLGGNVAVVIDQRTGEVREVRTYLR